MCGCVDFCVNCVSIVNIRILIKIYSKGGSIVTKSEYDDTNTDRSKLNYYNIFYILSDAI